MGEAAPPPGRQRGRSCPASGGCLVEDREVVPAALIRAPADPVRDAVRREWVTVPVEEPPGGNPGPLPQPPEKLLPAAAGPHPEQDHHRQPEQRTARFDGGEDVAEEVRQAGDEMAQPEPSKLASRIVLSWPSRR